MELLNAIILLLNYTIIPALTYGSQLALGAIFVTLIYGVLRFANFATGHDVFWNNVCCIVNLLFSISWNKFRSITYSITNYPIRNLYDDYVYANN